MSRHPPQIWLAPMPVRGLFEGIANPQDHGFVEGFAIDHRADG
jgi:hypothetical protein